MKLHGKTVRIISDNENYVNYLDKDLIITSVARSIKDHPGYDYTMNGEALCDLKVKDRKEDIPFSLYEYEFKVIN